MIAPQRRQYRQRRLVSGVVLAAALGSGNGIDSADLAVRDDFVSHSPECESRCRIGHGAPWTCHFYEKLLPVKSVSRDRRGSRGIPNFYPSIGTRLAHVGASRM